MGTFAERLKELRTRRKLTIGQIVSYAEVPRSTYVDWENGANAKLAEALIALANHYNTTVDYLVGRVDDSAIPDPRTLVDGDAQQLLEYFDNLSTDGQSTLLDIASSLVASETRRSAAIYSEQMIRFVVSDDEWRLIESARALARAGDEVGARRIIDDWLDSRGE